MKYNKQLTLLSLLIILLSLFASVAGVLPASGLPYTVTSLRGETIEIYGRGIYRNDTVSYAAQAKAQDYVTIFLGVPLLIISIIFTQRNSVRGRLLLAGTLGYFLYTYMSYAFLVSYNRIFLIYVALFALSLYAFILAFLNLDVPNIKEQFGSRFPRRSIAVFQIVVGAILTLMWLGRIAPSLDGKTVPHGLETYTTLVIQAMDLALIVPAAFVAGIALLKKKPIGYALATIIALKGVTMFTAVSAMGFTMFFEGMEIAPAELIIFPAATLVNFVFVWLILKNAKRTMI